MYVVVWTLQRFGGISKGEEINKDFPFSTGEEHGGFRYDVP